MGGERERGRGRGRERGRGRGRGREREVGDSGGRGMPVLITFPWNFVA